MGDQILGRRSATVAAILRRKRDSLVADWERRVRADPDVAPSKDLSEPALRDHIPDVMDELVRRLERGTDNEEQRREMRATRQHARSRFRQGYTTPEALKEWAHFRLAILDVLHREARLVDHDDALLVHLVIDEAAIASAIVLQKQTNAALAATERRYRALVESVGDAVVMLDTRGIVVTWSAAAERLFGYPADEIVGRSFRLFFPPADVRTGEPEYILGQAAETGHVDISGYRLRKSGASFWANLVVTPMQDGGTDGCRGELCGYATVTRDLTEQKRRVDELELHAAELSAIIESIPDGLYVGTRTSVSRANLRGLEMLGYASIDELNANISQIADRIFLRDAETGAPVAEHDLAFMRALSGETVVTEVLARRVDTGEDRVLRSSGAPIRARGRIVGAVVINTDVTEEHRRRKELIEEMNLVDRFIAILGHDLRNPLNAVTTGAELFLRRGELRDDERRIVGRILSSGQRMARIIEQLLDWTRARRGGIPIERKPCDLRTVAADVIAEIETANPTRKIRTSFAGDLKGNWDADRVAQALSNLLGNAVVHSPPDALISVRARADAKAVCIDVHNDGPPIPPEVLSSLFAPFRRCDPKHASGLGLGLYIVHEIAKAEGGSIDVHSTAAEGTTFRMVLPRY